jgi:hypothetical protein
VKLIANFINQYFNQSCFSNYGCISIFETKNIECTFIENSQENFEYNYKNEE